MGVDDAGCGMLSRSREGGGGMREGGWFISEIIAGDLWDDSGGGTPCRVYRCGVIGVSIGGEAFGAEAA